MHVTHFSPEYGHLIRVFRGFHNCVPNEFSQLVSSDVQFSAFFPVQSAVNQGLIAVAACAPIPASLREFPVFRTRSGGAGGAIWLWNGDKAVHMERKLQPDELKYPTRGIISAPLLIERIETEYRAETHEIW